MTMPVVTGVWHRLSWRERTLIVLGVLVVVLGAGWPLLWEPIQHEVAAGSIELARARAEAGTARRTADEIAGLARSVKRARTADPRAAVETVVGERGLRASLTALDANAGRVRLTFAAIDVAALAGLLDALGRDEQLFAREALLAARVEPGSVRAELTLARPDVR
jgi:type II secretory pathway component PulM